MSDAYDIFNTNPKEFENNTSSGESIMYKPKPKDGKGGTYKSYIRFVPNIENPRLPYIHKYIHYIKDEKGDGHYIDSPSTVGNKNDILTKRFFSLYNSENPKDREKASDLKRVEANFALIQIVKDDNRPDLNGKIKIFKFGQTIREKLEDVMYPSESGGDDDFVKSEPVNVFHPLSAPVFELNITLKEKFPNYNNCKFIDKKMPIMLLGDNGMKQPSEDENGKNEIINHLKQNSPSLKEYEYTPWDDKTEQFVQKIINKYYIPADQQQSNFDDIGSAVSQSTSVTSSNESSSNEGSDQFEKFVNEIDSEEDKSNKKEEKSQEGQNESSDGGGIESEVETEDNRKKDSTSDSKDLASDSESSDDEDWDSFFENLQ